MSKARVSPGTELTLLASAVAVTWWLSGSIFGSIMLSVALMMVIIKQKGQAYFEFSSYDLRASYSNLYGLIVFLAYSPAFVVIGNSSENYTFPALIAITYAGIISCIGVFHDDVRKTTSELLKKAHPAGEFFSISFYLAVFFASIYWFAPYIVMKGAPVESIAASESFRDTLIGIQVAVMTIEFMVKTDD